MLEDKTDSHALSNNIKDTLVGRDEVEEVAEKGQRTWTRKATQSAPPIGFDLPEPPKQQRQADQNDTPGGEDQAGRHGRRCHDD